MPDFRLRIATFAMVALFAVPSVLRAEDIPSADPAASRIRVGAAGTLVGGDASGRNASTAMAAPGLAVDLGIQLNDPVAIFVRAEFATDLFTTQGGGYLVAEWTPRQWLSVGTGAGYDMIYLLGYGNCSAKTFGPCSGNRFWSGPSIPLVWAFNLGRRDAHRARRRLLRLELEGAGGYQPATQSFGWHAGVGFGAAWM
ncbi:MAG: hypothetical protein M3O36_04325 [Myxococcota bacterium]|nr:hypothetical protein [Myxococcota bacterium]